MGKSVEFLYIEIFFFFLKLLLIPFKTMITGTSSLSSDQCQVEHTYLLYFQVDL